MPFYLYQLAYSGEALKAMVQNPSDREAAARKLVEALGGKLHHLFFAHGSLQGPARMSRAGRPGGPRPPAVRDPGTCGESRHDRDL